MDNMPAESGVYKKLYCHGNKNNCARYMIARKLGIQNTPSMLFPSHRTAVAGIISSHLGA